MLTALKVPFLPTFGLSGEEAKTAAELLESLGSIQLYVEQFEAAVELFDFSEAGSNTLDSERFRSSQSMPPPLTPDYKKKSRLFMQWRLLAGRDGAITIFNFGRALEYSRDTLLGRCLTWRETASMEKIKEAFALWEANFARFVAVRHSVAHAAEFSRAGKREEHTFYGEPDLSYFEAGGPVHLFISCSMHGRKFTSTFEKKIVGYELSRSTADILSSIAQTFFDAFEPVEKAVRDSMIKERSSQLKSKS